jgi:predicted Fe-Mo cluster-binding NifX family protein
MKVAFTAWEDRISPVFDSARTLMVARIEHARVADRRYEPFDPANTSRLAAKLKELEIEVLICGAITETPSKIIEAGGIELIAFVGGDIEEVLGAYAEGAPIVPAYSMPGCGRLLEGGEGAFVSGRCGVGKKKRKIRRPKPAARLCRPAVTKFQRED